jgi:Tfp pilus assembly protein PilF
VERIEKLKEFLADNPADSFVQHALALEYIKLGNDEEACVLFEDILEREPTYVGSYYHLAKLHERNGRIEQAIRIYETGMQQCTNAGDSHAFNELKGAWEELTF